MTTKKVAAVTDTSRDVFIEIREGDEVFARTPMKYMSALVFKATWERAHMDEGRTCEIVNR